MGICHFSLPPKDIAGPLTPELGQTGPEPGFLKGIPLSCKVCRFLPAALQLPGSIPVLQTANRVVKAK